MAGNLLYRPSWPQTCRDPSAFASQVLGLKVWAMVPMVHFFFQPNPLKKFFMFFFSRQALVCLG